MEFEEAREHQADLIDTSHPATRREFAALYQEEVRQRDKMFRSMAVDKIEIFTHRPLVEPILKFFKMREKKM